MVYKKYIKRNGKLYGPYVYESKRIDGKVVSEYHGSEEPKKEKGVKVNSFNYKKIFLFFIGAILLFVLIYFFIFNINKNSVSGNVIASIDSFYEQGEVLDGVLEFSLNEGELIPASSKIIFENSGISQEFNLRDFLDDSISEGKYYVKDVELEGEGEGYGLEGERVVYPELSFTLKIYKTVEADSEEDPEAIEEEIEENIIEEDSQVVEGGEVIEETSAEENQSAPITGNSIKSSGGFLSSFFKITGNVVSMELKQDISGKVSKDNQFVYDLNEGEEAELELKSVYYGEENLPDSVIDLKQEDNKIIITTDYSVVEKGYGKDYLGSKDKKLTLNLKDFNLQVEEGDLIIKVIYEDKEIFLLNSAIKEGEKVLDEVIDIPLEEEEEPILNEEVEINQEEVFLIKDISKSLTSEEREVILNKFGESFIQVVNSEKFKDRIIVNYTLGEYYIEYSYDSNLDENVLDSLMEEDRVKFLKDIARSLVKEDVLAEPINDFKNNYTF